MPVTSGAGNDLSGVSVQRVGQIVLIVVAVVVTGVALSRKVTSRSLKADQSSTEQERERT